MRTRARPHRPCRNAPAPSLDRPRRSHRARPPPVDTRRARSPPLADVPRIELRAPQPPPVRRAFLAPACDARSPLRESLPNQTAHRIPMPRRRTARASGASVRRSDEPPMPRSPSTSLPILRVNPVQARRARASLDPRNAGAILSRPPPAEFGRHSQAVRRRIANPLSPVQIRVPPPSSTMPPVVVSCGAGSSCVFILAAQRLLAGLLGLHRSFRARAEPGSEEIVAVDCECGRGTSPGATPWERPSRRPCGRP